MLNIGMKLKMLSKWRVGEDFFYFGNSYSFIPQHNSLKYIFPDGRTAWNAAYNRLTHSQP